MALKFHPDSLPDLSGRVYVVTGGNTGIGFHTVLHLAKHNAKVYLAARSAEKGTSAVESIVSTVPNAKVELLLMDLMILHSVVAATQEIMKKEERLHGLVNSAGIMAVPLEITADGFESQFQVNYLAHWLLTYRLMPLLQKTTLESAIGDVRIVNVSSMGHKAAPSEGIKFDDINLRDAFTFTRYGQSKLANVLHAKSLNDRFGPKSESAKNRGAIWAVSLHPGNIDTQLNNNSWGSSFTPVLRCFGVYIKPEEGSFNSLFAVASTEFGPDDCGEYFVPIAERSKPSSKANDVDLREKLYAWTEEEMRKRGLID